MAHAEKCPICGGSGRSETTQAETGTLVRKSQPCHGCGGKGWVEIGDMIPVFLSPMIPAPIFNPRPWQSDPYPSYRDYPSVTWWTRYHSHEVRL